MVRERGTRLVYSTGNERDPEAASEAAPRSHGASIRLHLDRRASSRVVTVVTGLPRDQAATLAPVLKAACGAGGTFKNGVLELQGDHRSRVEEELRSRGLSSKRAGG